MISVIRSKNRLLRVLLESKRVKPGSDRVLTQRPFSGPYFISDVIAGSGIGEAYKLIHVHNGRSIKSLVSGDRLKLYEADKREELSGRLPGVQVPSEVKLLRTGMTVLNMQ